jgi:hypothetical protein
MTWTGTPRRSPNALDPPAPETGALVRRRPRRLLVLARLGLALALLAYVLVQVEWTAVADYRHTLSWPWLAAFVGLIPLGHLVSSAKWRLLLAAAGHRVGLWRLTGLYLVGQFYNAVFPSTIGGDVVRSLGLRRIIGDTRTAFASTVAERFTGAAVLVLIGTIATFIALPGLMGTRDGIIDGRMAALLAFAAIGAATLAMVAMLSARTLVLLRAVFASATLLQPWLDKLERFQHALHEYRRKRAVMARAIGYSFLFHATTIGTIYTGCRMIGAPGADVGLLDAAVITPIILLIALLPLTPGGYGIVQWGYMVTFAAWNVGDTTDAATLGVFVSLMLTACNIGVSAAGYSLYTIFATFESGHDRGEGEPPPPTPPPLGAHERGSGPG